MPIKLMQEQIDFPGRSAVKVKVQEKPCFTYPWHFHPEYEILLVVKGEGTSYVADNIEYFSNNDLVLLGSNLPHFWRTAPRYHVHGNKDTIKYIVIQFSPDFFKEAVSEYPEFNPIRELLERSARGIRFTPSFAEKARSEIDKVVQTQGFERTIELLRLLHFLSQSSEYHVLAGELYEAEKHQFSSDRMTKVMHYLNTNYLQKIELEKVASVAHMHPAAFCRYFKAETGKSLSAFINDMRISYACRLLLEGKRTISQICYDSGFNNISNFNRTFKKHTGFTPSAYHDEFHGKKIRKISRKTNKPGST